MSETNEPKIKFNVQASIHLVNPNFVIKSKLKATPLYEV